MTEMNGVTLTSGEYYWVHNNEPLVFHMGGVRVEKPGNREPEVMMWWDDHFEQCGSDLYWWNCGDELKHLVVLAHIPKPGV
jgi:hypothetical protein